MADSTPHWTGDRSTRSAAPAFLSRLRNGWSSASSLPTEFTEAWRKLFDTATHSLVTDENLFEFGTELTAIKLRGMDSILCLGIGGDKLPDSPDFEIWR